MSVDKGFQVDRVLAVNVSLLATRYPKPEDRNAFFQRALEQAAALPACRGVCVSILPLTGEMIDIVGKEMTPAPPSNCRPPMPASSAPRTSTPCASTSPKGRDFEEQDRSRKVAIVSASLAQRVWGGEDPIGRASFRHNGQLDWKLSASHRISAARISTKSPSTCSTSPTGSARY